MMLAMALGTNVSSFLLHTSRALTTLISSFQLKSAQVFQRGSKKAKVNFTWNDRVLALLHYVNLLS